MIWSGLTRNRERLSEAGSRNTTQNQPRARKDFDIRTAFIAGPGKKLIVSDYDQLEMFLLAHFCLHQNVTVSTADGAKKRTIRKIVNQRWKGPVWSYDFSAKSKVKTRVKSHFKNGLPVEVAPFRGGLHPNDWLIIYHEGSTTPLIVTRQHKVFLPDGSTKSAGDLEVGDLLVFEEPEICGCQLQIVLGGLLGNGDFYYGSSTGHYGVEIYSSHKQRGYIAFKARVLSNIRASRYVEKRSAPSSDMIRVKTHTSYQISRLRPLFFVDSTKKQASPQVINLLDRRGLAIWYCDDGSLSKDPRCSPTKGFSASIACSRLTDAVISRLNGRFGLEFRRQTRGMGLSGSNAEQFFQLIAPAVHPSMQYKLPEYWRGQFDPDLWDEPVPQVTSVMVTRIHSGDVEPKRFTDGSGSKYDLEVSSEAHNFFANGVLVSNSKDEGMIANIMAGKDIHTSNVELVWGEPYDEVAAAKKNKDDKSDRAWYLRQLRDYVKVIGFGRRDESCRTQTCSKRGNPTGAIPCCAARRSVSTWRSAA